MRSDGFWYRAEVKHYSIADEYGDHAYTSAKVVITRFCVVKFTPKGVWLSDVWSNITDPWILLGQNPKTLFHTVFVNGSTMRQYAVPTIELAYIDCIKRLERKIAGDQARMQRSINDLRLVKNQLDKQSLPYK